MGNQLALASAPAQPSEYLGDLPGVVYKDSLGGGRFLKTVSVVPLGLHADGVERELLCSLFLSRVESSFRFQGKIPTPGLGDPRDVLFSLWQRPLLHWTQRRKHEMECFNVSSNLLLPSRCYACTTREALLS